MDPEVKKRVLRQIGYGLYVLSARKGDEVAAATVSWLSQASFSPPLVMVGIRADSHLHQVVERAGAFAVGIVPQSGRDLAAAFFRPSQVENGRINGYAFKNGPATGAPILTDLPSWFEARVVDSVKRGDHSVFLAEVIEAGQPDPQAKPLVLSETTWNYGG